MVHRSTFIIELAEGGSMTVQGIMDSAAISDFDRRSNGDAGMAVRTELVVQVILGMPIWLAKCAQGVGQLTADSLMVAIDAFSFHGLESRH